MTPVQSSVPVKSGALMAARKPRQINTAYNSSTNTPPTSPSSSQKMENKVHFRHRQIEQFLHTVAQAAAKKATGAQRIEGLVDLPADVVFIHCGQNPPQPVFIRGDEHHRRLKR